MSLGGIVLCGGLSSRIGTAKALLPFGAETMLARVVRRLGAATARIVVVAARDQPLPPLPPEIIIVRDRQPVRGPLEGLRTGLAALDGSCDAAFLTGCDGPLLVPAFVRRLHDLLGEYDIAMPLVAGTHEPLSAIYRVRLLGLIDELLANRRAGPVELARRASTRLVSADELRQADSELDTLMDVDNPEDYQAALRRAGLSASSRE
jgi:molybdenum cofactor guanylyltransferase